MSLFYSTEENSNLFNSNDYSNYNQNGTIFLDEDGYENNSFVNNDELKGKISYEENDTFFQFIGLKKISGIDEIIKGEKEFANNSNYSDKSTNEDEASKNQLLNKKRKSVFYAIKVPKVKKLNIESNTSTKKANNERRGRISKESKLTGKHNRHSDDNIINKIKVHIFYFIRDIIKQNSNGRIDLKKIGNKFSADLKVNKNTRQYNMKIKDILMEEEISTKYSTLDRFENKKIINEIYVKNEEKKAIQILELTFEEIFILFRKKLNNPKDKEKIELIAEKIKGLDLLDNNDKYKDIEYFIKEIKENYKQKISDNELDEYISNIKRLCLGYINWFDNKIGRP